MLRKAPDRHEADSVDLLVINDGEETFVDVVALADRSAAALLALPGVAVRVDGGWRETPARPLSDLDSLASPYAMNLVQHGGLGVLQTYRGCPFTCSFCEWGTMESPKRVRDVARLGAELGAIERHDVHAALLVDAGLNLNKNAFENLRRAADGSGFFTRHGLICEVNPAAVRQEHLDFLGSVADAYVGIGLQSFDNAVLANVERKYDEARFDETFGKLHAVASIAVEIILGLPGDSPEQFPPQLRECAESVVRLARLPLRGPALRPDGARAARARPRLRFRLVEDGILSRLERKRARRRVRVPRSPGAPGRRTARRILLDLSATRAPMLRKKRLRPPMDDTEQTAKTRALRKYEAEAVPAPLRGIGPGQGPALAMATPYGPLVGRAAVAPALVDRLNAYADGEITRGQGTEFLVPPAVARAGGPEGLLVALEALIAAYVRAAEGAPPARIAIDRIWIVSQYAGTPSPVHFHSGDLSGVLYLKAPETPPAEAELAKTYISGRQAGYLNFMTGGKQRFAKTLLSVPPETGTIYLFPGWLLHGAEPFRGPGERRSLSFNASVD